VSKLVVRKRATGRDRRRLAVRKKINGTQERPRLSVFRGNKGMCCQIIDDANGSTIVHASSLEKEFKMASPSNKTEKARLLGAAIAKRAVEKGITTVVFDRGGYKYHGRVKALADAARENGLKF
jgi:large subunit ribosomal protein L18